MPSFHHEKASVYHFHALVHPQNVQLLNIQLQKVQLKDVKLPDYQTSNYQRSRLPNVQLQNVNNSNFTALLKNLLIFFTFYTTSTNRDTIYILFIH
jgi:hypothetical protein